MLVELLDNMKISKQVQDIVDKSNKPFDVIKGLSHNYRETINRIYFYKNDRFVECSDDNAIFWNVVKPYIMHFAKNIDLDTKDFRAVGKGETNYAQSWILDIRFKKWADENNLSIKIDDLTQLVSEFGSFVWKLVKNEDGKYDIDPCDLRNLYFDPSVPSIRRKEKVEMHYLTDDEIREKSDVWDNTEEIILKAKEDDKEFERKEIWEFTGWEGTGKDRKFKHVFGAGYGDAETIAFEEVIEPEEDKYFDFHLEKFSGTWLRKGAYENNFILQERANTLINQEADATAIASLLLLRSEDPNTKGNVLQGAISGQIINSRDLQQIAVDNRAAGTLMNGVALIEAQVRKNLLLPDVATGDELPSGTTFRGQAMMSNAYKSAFKQMRNRLAEPLKDLIGEYILPDLVKDWNREDLIELAGSENDIEMYDEAVKTYRKLQLMEQKNALGEPLMPGELEAMDADTEQQIGRIGRKIEIGKKFFNFEYGFSIDPVGESYDKAQQNEALTGAINMEQINPAITDSPRYKQLCENNGISQAPLKPQVREALMINNQGQSIPSVQSLSSVVDTGSI